MAVILNQCLDRKPSPYRFFFRNNRAISQTLRDFAVEEKAVAMTEYLILLGLLVGGAIGAVIYVAAKIGTGLHQLGQFLDLDLIAGFWR